MIAQELPDYLAIPFVMWQIHLHEPVSMTDLQYILDRIPTNNYKLVFQRERLAELLQIIRQGGFTEAKPIGRGYQYLLSETGRKQVASDLHMFQAYGENLIVSTRARLARVSRN